jgi:adenosylcobinamide-GDP ribazoletransferase
MPDFDRANAEPRNLVGDFTQALGFLTRIPVAERAEGAAERPDFRDSGWTFPVVGIVVGIGGGIVYALGTGLGLSPLLAAALAVTAGVVLTGAIHEDGLSDTVDGFGGGKSATAKLEIMRDHQIGAYGAIALVLSVLLRVTAITEFSHRGAWAVLGILIAAEAISRAAIVRMWHDLPAARVDGLSKDTGSPDGRATMTTLAVAAVIVAVTAIPAAGFWAALIAAAGTAAVVFVFTGICRNQIGGQTGDTLGAVQQVALVSFLILIAVFT